MRITAQATDQTQVEGAQDPLQIGQGQRSDAFMRDAAQMQRVGTVITSLAVGVAAETTAQYVQRTFTPLSGTKVLIQAQGMKVEDAEKILGKINRTSDRPTIEAACDPAVLARAKENGRVLDNGPFYPYVTPSGNTEGKGRVALLSINGAMARVAGQEVPVAGGKPQLARDIAKLEAKYGKTLLGFRAVDLESGLFAIHYVDGGQHKMGLFSITKMPAASEAGSPEYWKQLADVIHPAMVAVVGHYFK